MSNAALPMSIKRISTADQVASLVRDRILRGEIKPGTALREVVLAASIGVSRNTLREALRILIQEGLVRHTVHRGITVTSPTPAAISDIYHLRRVLETTAIESSRPSKEMLARLSAAVKKLEAATSAHDWAGLVDADLDFHRLLVSMLGSERLEVFYGNLLSELRLGLVQVDRAASDLHHFTGPHRRFYRLLAAGKRKECARELRAHLEEAERVMRSVLEK